jgi:hypothetical protein
VIVAIHQPDFLPWGGFFAKMIKSDIFVILDHTENNPRSADFWGRRVRIAVNDNAYWLSVPLIKPAGRIGIPVKTIEIGQDEVAKHAMLKSLTTFRQNYGRTPYYATYSGLVEDYFASSEPLLAARNLRFILAVKEILEIKAAIVNSSSLGCVGKSNNLLVQILKATGGDTYLSGDGAVGYMEHQAFANEGIQVAYNNFAPPFYLQCNTRKFIPGLSIIDMLMNIGARETARLLSNQQQVPAHD